MTNINAFNQYKENSINTASPEELTLMLYNGLIKFVLQAYSSVENKEMEKANNAIIRAQDIILYLRETLNMDFEMSAGMDMLYEYMYNRLVEANTKKSTEILDEVLGYAKDFRDTWAQAMKIAKQPVKKVAGLENVMVNKVNTKPQFAG